MIITNVIEILHNTKYYTITLFHTEIPMKSYLSIADNSYN